MANYVVQAGDTLSKIAKAHGLTVKQLAEMNGIKDVNKIKVGQELVFNFEGEAVGDGIEHTMTDEEMLARLKQQAEEIQALRDKTILEQVGEEIQEDLDALAEALSKKYNMAKEDVLKLIEEGKEGLEKAWQSGKDAYEVAKNKIDAECQKIANGVKETYNKGVNAAEDGARSVANTGKKVAGKVHDALKADIPEEPEEVDTSKMTKEELLAYNDQLIQKYKDESLTDRARREIREKLDEVERTLKTKWNSGVDGVHARLSDKYHGIADVVKGVFNWLRGN